MFGRRIYKVPLTGSILEVHLEPSSEHPSFKTLCLVVLVPDLLSTLIRN